MSQNSLTEFFLINPDHAMSWATMILPITWDLSNAAFTWCYMRGWLPSAGKSCEWVGQMHPGSSSIWITLMFRVKYAFSSVRRSGTFWLRILHKSSKYLGKVVYGLLTVLSRVPNLELPNHSKPGDFCLISRDYMADLLKNFVLKNVMIRSRNQIWRICNI